MNRRIRWLQADVEGLSLSALAERMLTSAYTDEQGWGFQIEESGRKGVHGIFVERLLTNEEVEDPFGKTIRYARVEFRKVRFRWSVATPNLELLDPPRSTKEFMARLGVMTEQRLTIEPVRPDVLRWLRALETRVGRARVRTIGISGVALSTSVRADVIVVGGADVRKEANRLLGERKGEVSSIEVEWREGDTQVVCELTRSGARFPLEVEDEVTTRLREALRSTLEKPGATR